MSELLTAGEMRAIEEAAIASGRVSGLELMERAGRGVVETALDRQPRLARSPHRAVVLCGPGNNGGDGFVVARLLRERGWEVALFLHGEEPKLPPDAAENARRWLELGAIALLRAEDALAAYQDAHMSVDALFGTGLGRPLRGEMGSLIQEMQRCERGCFDVAVDMPSGICSDSGRALKQAVVADLTVTFHAQKIGHHLADGPGHCGEVRIVDIGL